jgi:hypothetical protein
MYEEAAYGICKISRQLVWQRRPSTFEVFKHDLIIFVNGFCLVEVSAFSLLSCGALQCP